MESRLWSVLHVVVAAAAAAAVGWSMMTTFPEDDDDDCDHTLPLHFHYYSPPPNIIHIPHWYISMDPNAHQIEHRGNRHTLSNLVPSDEIVHCRIWPWRRKTSMTMDEWWKRCGWYDCPIGCRVVE